MIAPATACVVLLAWGAFAFGAVYPWAYWPLLAASAFCGAWLWRRGAAIGRTPSRPMVSALAVLAAAVLLQLVPVSWEWLGALHPSAQDFLRSADVRFAPGALEQGSPWHPLSIAPMRTATGLAFVLALGVLALGCQVGLRLDDTSQLLRHLAVLGVAIAIVSVVQRGSGSEHVYGFWTPRFTTRPGAPFINRNHLAGWMLMAIPAVAGYLAARVADLHRSGGSLRTRALWLTRAPGAEGLLVGFALTVMSLALLLTLSRSGMLAFAALAGVLLLASSLKGRGGRIGFATGVVVFLATVVLWAGVERLTGRFMEMEDTVQSRQAAWVDAVAIARDFFPAGSGLNTYGIVSTVYEPPTRPRHFAEAHNDYLQLAAEGGLLLGLPALVAVWVTAREVLATMRGSRARPADYWPRVGAALGLVGIALQEAVEFSLQMPGNAVLCAVLIGVATRRLPPGLDHGRSHDVAR